MVKKAMEVGYYFQKELVASNDKRVAEWSGSEDCATFAKIIIDYAEEHGCDINTAYYEITDQTVSGICDGSIPVEDHMWDDYCRGFLAGEIIGYPTEKNITLLGKAEELWENQQYGYYQEVLNKVIF